MGLCIGATIHYNFEKEIQSSSSISQAILSVKTYFLAAAYSNFRVMRVFTAAALKVVVRAFGGRWRGSGRSLRMRFWAIPLLLLNIAGCARSDIYYYTEIGGQRCFFEDLSKDSLVEGLVH